MEILDLTDSIYDDIFEGYKSRDTITTIPPSGSSAMQREMFDCYSGPSALITWTSGSTGGPKGVIVPWQAVEARCRYLRDYYDSKGLLDCFERVYSYMPPPNSGGAISSIMFSKLYAGELLIETPEAATALTMTPFTMKKLIAKKAFDTANTKLVVTIGQSLDLETQIKAERFFDAPVIEMYGCSEAGGISMNKEVMDGFEVRCIDDVIHVKSEALASGYLGNLAFPLSKDGWLKTNDRGAIVDGKLMIMGRSSVR